MKTDVYWIYLQNIIGYGSRKLLKILDMFETAENFYKASYDRKIKSGLFNRNEIDRIDKFDIDSAYKIIDKCERLGYKIVTPENPAYPMRLKHLVDPPAVLYVLGTLPEIDDEVMIAIVGARKASDYSRALARELGERLTKAGAYIVSGGAVGIDTSSHTGALSASGKTIAVLACGLNYGYLAKNEPLRMDIAANGALISEFAPDFPVYSSNFHIRNRLISGLCLGTVVVEAGRKSGALITVSHALEQGRDIFVIPGDVSSERYVGSNMLIRDGAKIITSPLDILEEYTHIYPHRINIDGCSQMLKGDTSERGLFDDKFDENGEFVRDDGNDRLNVPQNNRSDDRLIKSSETRSIFKNKDKPKRKKSDVIGDSAVVEDYLPDKSRVNLSADGELLYLSFNKTVMLFDQLVDISGLPVSRALSAATELEIMGVAEAIAGGRYKICL